MKPNQNPIQRLQIHFKIILFVFTLVSLPLLGADDLSEAQVFEREGNLESARESYISWLKSHNGEGLDHFGRILIHTLRIPGTLENDLHLIEEYLSGVTLKEDKLILIETILVLYELTGDEVMKQRYLNLFLSLDDQIQNKNPALTRILIQGQNTATGEFLSQGNVQYTQVKSKFIADLRNQSDDQQLLVWLENTHKQFPSLLNDPDWLFLVQNKLNSGGYESQASRFRKMLYQSFPESVETLILKEGNISHLPHPDSLNLNPEIFETLPVLDDLGPSEPESNSVPIMYIQAGAFQSYENALNLKEELASYDELSQIVAEDTVYKVIIFSKDLDVTQKKLEVLGIKGFRIPQIP
ncbi:SPOR domain-containing protein [Oceanispirochaeta crateris]|uniref:SPOR domain-containing protein n=1 Tax=Oceanispirochaeta crateris TaxID=2518645 RepID=A0A5C1QM98_9SPIO|nr:SPOR domain-containing protein [Oceanispirochaeta crateris]QEN07686.1 SPOR domain-containing protein [Oceanispirochaeta crateris]